ncbi:MAG: DUF3575 domain-containing protein [Bergeyella sp.]
MKKLLFATAFSLGFVTANAQTETATVSSERNNDIMISPIELIAAPLLNVSYERLLNEDSGVGLNAMFFLEGDEDYKFSQFSPYYRMYFGKKYASGFFVEGFVPITSSTDSYTTSYYDDNGYREETHTEKGTTAGIGIGFGAKWVAKKNIIFEASMGVARRFGNSDDITGKGMLGIGYRF